MYACLCRAIPEADVRRAGRRGHLSPEALIAVLRLDDEACCGRCVDDIERFVALAADGAAEAHAVAAGAGSHPAASRRPAGLTFAPV